MIFARREGWFEDARSVNVNRTARLHGSLSKLLWSTDSFLQHCDAEGSEYVRSMRTTHLLLLHVSLLWVLAHTGPPLAAESQLGAPIELIPLANDSQEFLTIQRTSDGRLSLTPNEAFFPLLGLRAEGAGETPDVDGLNKGQSFATIRRWDAGDVAEWGLWFSKPGRLNAQVRINGDGQFSLSLGNQARTVRSGGTLTFTVDAPGRRSLRLVCKNGGAAAVFHRILVSGEAASGAAVVRKRWRPAAAHTRFSSSHEPDSVRLWVMEMDARPGSLGFYSPVTTPFGYYGPSWNADGTVNSSFNFSLWSYGRNQPEPPIEQLSHLIAIGHPDAQFGTFGHEGTGVKIRNWDPLEGQQGQTQAFALRVEPGDTYDTYYSYFYAGRENRWRFFGAGKKFNRGKPLPTLTVGGFVEVPGPANVQRTGPYERRMRYRGWVMDLDEHWHPLDRMHNGNVDRDTNLTHTNRGVTDDHRFFLETGGWTFRKPPNSGNDVVLTAPQPRHQVKYLRSDDVEFLKTVPCGVDVTKLESGGRTATVHFDVRNSGANPEASVYWGTTDGLTFFDRWENSQRVPNLVDGPNTLRLDDVDPASRLYVRVFLKNEFGQFWSTETVRSTLQ